MPTAPKKKSTSRAQSSHSSDLSYLELIKEAITELKERNGSSRQAISKYVSAKKSNFASHFLNRALRDAVTTNKLIQVKGSYKLPSSAQKKDDKKPSPKVKKTATKATKPKKAATSKKSPGGGVRKLTKAKKKVAKKTVSGKKPVQKKA